MRISFQHANPDAGNETVLMRFGSDGGENPCVLVDAGHGVDLDAILRPADRLVAVCLTHAHLDHYASITAAHRHDAPILTSPATAAALEHVFDVADMEYDVETTAAVTDAVTPVTAWTTVAPGIDVHPVPAGHVPGAVGFLVRARDDGETHHLLATGDVTRRRAGGFPGFDPAGLGDVDVLFLPASTDDGFEAALTEALGTALEHAHGGSRTLVATSGLVGVQVSYLLAAIAAEYDLHVPIRVVGQVAKLYEALAYDCPGVEPVPVFGDTDECLGHGGIAIAGPEIPHERSSGRLFGVLEEDPNACVVQLVGSGGAPLTDARCTVRDFEIVNHPPRETLVEIHEAVAPTETVIVHSHGGAKGAFNDLSSVVWGTGDTDEHTLYDGSQWRLPPWMGGGSVIHDRTRSGRQLGDAELLATVSVPSLDRHETPDLAAEGIDTAALATRLHRGPNAAASPDAPHRTDDRPTPSTHDSRTEAVTDTTDDTDPSGPDDRPADAGPPTTLVQTTTPELGDEIDPALAAALEETSLTRADLAAALTASQQAAEHESPDREESAATETDPTDSTDTEDGEAEGDPDGDGDAEADGEAGPPAETEAAGEAEEEETAAPPTVEPDAASDETPADEPSEPVPDAADGEATAGGTGAPTDTATAAEPVGNGAGADTDADTATTPSASAPAAATAADGWALTLHPVAVALADRLARSEAADSGACPSVDAVVAEAVDRYLVALLAGEATGGPDERFVVDLDGSPLADRALAAIVDETTAVASTQELVAEGVSALLREDPTANREVRGLDAHRARLYAVVANDAYVFDDVAAVVEAAIAWATGAESPADGSA